MPVLLLAGLLALLLVVLVGLAGLLAGLAGGLAEPAYAQAVADGLTQPPSPRRYGLAVALAVIALVGAGSLVLRVRRARRRW